MALNLSIKEIVVVMISIVMLIAGILFVLKVSEIKEVLPDAPVPKEQAVEVEVEPASSQQGTLFLVKARYFEEREQQDLMLIVEKGDYLSPLKLYDDGKHYDKEAGDGIYAGFFDSEDKGLGRYEIKAQEQTLASFVVYEPGCENIAGGEETEGTKINFVILPAGYDNYEEFKYDAIKLLKAEDSLLNIEPFKSNRDKFSFSIVNTSRELGCKIGCYNVSTLLCCNNKAVFEEASRCHYDSILVLFKSKELCGAASSYAKVCSKNKLSALALVHEIGHSFADLADEYVYSDYFDYDIGEIDKVNCAREGCEKWKELTDNCYKGCTYSHLYRPARKDSIMYRYVPVFNIVCEEYIKKLIENYSRSEEEMERMLPGQKSYFVNLDYNGGEVEVKSIFLKPIKANVVLKKSDYDVVIKDREGRNVFETALYLPEIIFPLPGSVTTAIMPRKFDFSFVLPYSTEAENMIIYKNRKEIEKMSLVVFSETCGNGICDKVENHLTCSEDCSIRDGFCETSVCDPDCKSQKYCEKIKDREKIIFMISVGLIIIALVLLVSILVKAGFMKAKK